MWCVYTTVKWRVLLPGMTYAGGGWILPREATSAQPRRKLAAQIIGSGPDTETVTQARTAADEPGAGMRFKDGVMTAAYVDGGGQEPDMIQVAIVDDHPIARRGVEQVLTESGSMRVLASVPTPGELAVHLQRSDSGPDVVILDLYHDGDEPCLAAIAELRTGTRVLVMSVSGRPEDVIGAIRAGASGYITKQALPAMFVAAVEAVSAGGFWLSSQLADIVQTELMRPIRRTSSRTRAAAGELSAREAETLDWIARGFTHAQVATRMGVSKATVNTYVERIRVKLQVGNKAELTRAALTRLSRTSGS
jgi:two-component system, NarL family, nitrate/nitrite response regulator NarL